MLEVLLLDATWMSDSVDAESARLKAHVHAECILLGLQRKQSQNAVVSSQAGLVSMKSKVNHWLGKAATPAHP